MISICSSIYHETESLEIFVRSIIANASDPNDLEIIIVNDDGYEPTTKVLRSLSEEFPQLKYLVRTRKERISFLEKVIALYQENHIFVPEIINDMYLNLDEYKRKQSKNLWFPPGELFNLAVSQSKGDVLMVLPSDYICGFDATELYNIYNQTKQKEGSFVGHLDWIDLTSLDPMPDIYGTFIKEKNSYNLKKFTQECFDRAQQDGLTIILGQHGARIVDRESFNKVGGFDGRWFIRAWNDDCFNEKLKKIIAPTYRLMDRMEFQESHALVGAIRPNNYKPPVYLTSKYSAIPNVHEIFLERIREYLGMEEVK